MAIIRNAFLVSLLGTLVSANVSQCQQDRTSRGKVIAANVSIGGLTGGLSEALSGRSFWRGLVGGSIGGGTVFVGKCLVAQRKPWTDWVGREIGALGGSIVANASSGGGLLSELAFPVGPIRLYSDRTTGTQRIKLDLGTVVAAIYTGLQTDVSFKPASSVRHGALMFEDEVLWRARTTAGVVMEMPNPPRGGVAHELVHVGQYDFVALAWQAPLEKRLLEHLPGGRTIHRHVDLGLLLPVWAILNSSLSVQQRPWETEARFFSGGC